MVKMLTVLISTISNSQMLLLKTNVSSFCFCKSYSHFFSKNINKYAIFNDQSFNDTRTNDIVSFEQLSPDYFPLYQTPSEKVSTKREELALMESKFFPFRVVSFQNGVKYFDSFLLCK